MLKGLSRAVTQPLASKLRIYPQLWLVQIADVVRSMSMHTYTSLVAARIGNPQSKAHPRHGLVAEIQNRLLEISMTSALTMTHAGFQILKLVDLPSMHCLWFEISSSMVFGR